MQVRMETPPPRREEQSLAEWLLEPQTLIALSAVLIGACGLFISLYEASLMRQEQRAAVWPRVSLGFTVNDSIVTFGAENAGVGPARVQAAWIQHEDSTLANWGHLIRQLPHPRISVQQNVSLINGRVLSPEKQTQIVRLTFEDPHYARDLARFILNGSTDVRVCYCSVYDDCWTTSLQDGLPPGGRIGLGLGPDSTRSPVDSSRGSTGIPQPEPVPSCDGMDQSVI